MTRPRNRDGAVTGPGDHLRRIDAKHQMSCHNLTVRSVVNLVRQDRIHSFAS